MSIVTQGKRTTVTIGQDESGAVVITIVTSPVKDQSTVKLASVGKRFIKTAEVALIVEGIL